MCGGAAFIGQHAGAIAAGTVGRDLGNCGDSHTSQAADAMDGIGLGRDIVGNWSRVGPGENLPLVLGLSSRYYIARVGMVAPGKGPKETIELVQLIPIR